MIEVIGVGWVAAAHGDDAWRKALRGYRATADCPAAAFWGRAGRGVPDANVILTTRDEDTWLESSTTPSSRPCEPAIPPPPWSRAVSKSRPFPPPVASR